MDWKISVILPTAALLMSCAATHSVAQPNPGTGHAGNVYKNLAIFAEVLSIVRDGYVKEPDVEKFMAGAIEGGLKTLDPQSSYLTPEAIKLIETNTQGMLGEPGIDVGVKEGILTVIAPFGDTPASRAGLKVGDKILKIGDESTKDLSETDAWKRLAGKPGTQVSLLIKKASSPEPKVYTFPREIMDNVKTRVMGGGIGYIRLSNFRQGSDTDLGNGLEALKKEKEGLRGLVLDLRNNQGGLLSEAVKVADMFLDSGIIVYTDGRSVSQKAKYIAHKEGTLTEVPIVILVNSRTAAGAEIVAGSLQVHGRGRILGMPTAGKGSLQTILPLEGGSALRLTTAFFFIGKTGVAIEGKGVQPDVVVEEGESGDPQLERALGLLRQGSVGNTSPLSLRLEQEKGPLPR